MTSQNDSDRNQPPGYVPSAVWKQDAPSGGTFANINRPVSGATHDKALPVGDHKLQLYSLGTPNGQKVSILLEELLAAGHADAEYDAWNINIGEGEQFSSGFVNINPNSKIPAMVDHSGETPVKLFESGSILIHLAEKFGAFLPTDNPRRAEVLNWLMWQMGAAPFLGGGFGHFYHYAPFKMKYSIDRYAMEVKRQLHVLDTHLAGAEFIAGDYSIADMAIWPWYGKAVIGTAYNAQEFLNVVEYTHVRRWAEQLAARPAVKRGAVVNTSKLRNRHSASDFDALELD